jgi:hypothetical protein
MRHAYSTRHLQVEIAPNQANQGTKFLFGFYAGDLPRNAGTKSAKLQVSKFQEAIIFVISVCTYNYYAELEIYI